MGIFLHLHRLQAPPRFETLPVVAARVPSTLPAGRAPEGPIVLAAGALVEVVIEYPACALRRSGRGPLPVGLLGLDARQVSRALGGHPQGPQGPLHGYEVRALTPQLLVLRRTAPGCPAATVTLVGQDGVVTVLSGPPGDTGAVLRRTPIPLRGLARVDQARLERGFPVPATRCTEELGRLARQAGLGEAAPSC
jgi:hypothetical protein